MSSAATLDPAARIAKVKAKVENSVRNRTHAHAPESTKYIPVIIKTQNPDALPDFVNQLQRRGNLVIATVDQSRLGDLGDIEISGRVEAGLQAVKVMDLARQTSNIPLVRKSESLPEGLSGNGVVVGLCDIGFDPNHINFFDHEGRLRVGKSVVYNLANPYPTISLTPDGILVNGIDNTDESHATHVAGIMAGSDDASGFQGIASSSEIVSCCGDLYDALLLDGCERIIEYAREKGKPSVINMSIADYTGPHDGTTLFNQYMKMLCEDASICISAGNDAYRDGHILKTFSWSDTRLKSYVAKFGGNQSPDSPQGAVDIWTRSDKPLTAAVTISALTDGKISGADDKNETPGMRWDAPEGSSEWVITTSDLAPEFEGMNTQLLPEGYDGYIYVTAEVNPENHRRNITIQYDLLLTDNSKSGTQVFGFEIQGEDGETVEVYSTEGICLKDYADSSATQGDYINSVNDFCAAEGPICVGAWQSRDYGPNYQMPDWHNPLFKLNEPCYFSSFGTLESVGVLPHVTAPGACIVSSLSPAYHALHPEGKRGRWHDVRVVDGKEYVYWYCEGTSMSSPFVAGTIALWLEAVPSLTPAQIKEIVIASAQQPTLDTDNPRWGRGLLDAKAGLDMARRLAGVNNAEISKDHGEITLVKGPDGNWAVSFGGKEINQIQLYDVAGRCILSREVNATICWLESALPSGLYILTATVSDGMQSSQKIRI